MESPEHNDEFNAPADRMGGDAGNLAKREGKEFLHRAFADFFAFEAGPNVLEWLEKTLPDVAEHKRSMNPEEFADWFSLYLEQKWIERKSSSSQT